MKTIRAACWRLFGLFRKKHGDAEFAAEIQHHLDLLAERKIAAGMLPDEARNATLREFGGVEQCKELAREERVWMWPDELWNAHPVAVTYTQRLAVVLLAIFGGTAVLLAAIGLYAVVSYAVSQNTRELALRMALGARISDLLRLVLSRGVALTAGGLIIGAIAALALTRLLGNRLYKVSTYDPVAFGSAFLLMSVVALLACLLPARRATRIDPARVLRA
jgi:predicted lysophospholipase L1 biosynthesis ABC-type transport system permease subunit